MIIEIASDISLIYYLGLDGNDGELRVASSDEDSVKILGDASYLKNFKFLVNDRGNTHPSSAVTECLIIGINSLILENQCCQIQDRRRKRMASQRPGCLEYRPSRPEDKQPQYFSSRVIQDG